ncbi:MAG: heavy-metal-associated domain-containing protein [candidate division Zixibacteria bacterium]|nr:heavy-metal-associated domain-containing protein [candidate division Zixibacteria bacterium]
MFGKTEVGVFTVKGMTCGHCEKRVETALGQVDGVGKAKASHAQSTVEVTYRKGNPPDTERIVHTIANLGFKVVSP